VLSNDLDEMVIWQIISQITTEAPRYGVDPEALINRLTFGVGTRLITSQGDPALGGVYKLVAVHDHGDWKPAIKVSESPFKTPSPGHKQTWRLYDKRDKATADLLGLSGEDPSTMEHIAARHPSDYTKARSISRSALSGIEPLLVDILREGKLVYDLPDIEAIRRQRNADTERLDAGVRRLINPHIYHVSLTQKLWDLKQELIASASGGTSDLRSVIKRQGPASRGKATGAITES
jgi:nicotinate phosphoribosyltransferase